MRINTSTLRYIFLVFVFLVFTNNYIIKIANAEVLSDEDRIDLEDFIFENMDYPRSISIMVPLKKHRNFINSNTKLVSILEKHKYIKAPNQSQIKFFSNNKNVLYETYDLHYKITGHNFVFGIREIEIVRIDLIEDGYVVKLKDKFYANDEQLTRDLANSKLLDVSSHTFTVKISADFKSIIH